MNEEKILLYRNEPEYNRVVGLYQAAGKQIQEMIDTLAANDVTADMDLIKSIISGKDLTEEILKRAAAECQGLPKALQEIVINDKKAALGDKIKVKAVDLKRLMDNAGSFLNLDHFSISEGTVLLSTAYKDEIDNWYSIFADTEARKELYAKWLTLKEAIEAFTQAYKDAPKRKLSSIEERMGVLLGITAIGTSSIDCLVKISENGEPSLNGEYFGYIQ